MREVRFVDQGGEKVLLIDFSCAKEGRAIVETAEAAMRMVRSTNQPRSVSGLLDLTGTRLDKVVRGAMKRMSQNNGPYMKSVAFDGLGVVLTGLFKGWFSVTGRSNHKVFKTRRDALEWLARN